MKKSVFIILLIATVITSCKNTEKGEVIDVIEVNKDLALITNQQSNEGYNLMKNNCYVCHNSNVASHDDIVAPPFKGVKMHYMRQYDNKEDFVNAIVDWVQNPDEDKALMFGAVKRFKLMPKLPLPTKDLEKIASYMYENEVDKPRWMEEHMKGKQGGNKGNMKNKGCSHKDGESCGNNC